MYYAVINKQGIVINKIKVKDESFLDHLAKVSPEVSEFVRVDDLPKGTCLRLGDKYENGRFHCKPKSEKHNPEARHEELAVDVEAYTPKLEGR